MGGIKNTVKTLRKQESIQCEICDAIFKDKWILKRHIASVHEGKKPFECEICDKRFPLNNVL